MIHLVFNTADIAAIEAAIELDETLAGKVIEIKDDYAVGPLLEIYETEGYQTRRDWWQNVLAFSPYSEQLDIVDDKFNYVIALNNWVNITIIKRGVRFTYYVNGNIDKSTPLIQNPISTLVSMRIGAITCCTPEYFNGKIDDIRFYNRALSDTEITYLATH